jgi:hypothetical protein
LLYCPGCKSHHLIDKRWALSGDVHNPSFTPSVFVNAGTSDACHSFITNGQWHFLGDCGHELAGQIIDLELVEET